MPLRRFRAFGPAILAIVGVSPEPHPPMVLLPESFREEFPLRRPALAPPRGRCLRSVERTEWLTRRDLSHRDRLVGSDNFLHLWHGIIVCWYAVVSIMDPERTCFIHTAWSEPLKARRGGFRGLYSEPGSSGAFGHDTREW